MSEQPMDLRELQYQIQRMAEKETLLESRINELEAREAERVTKRAEDERKFWITGITTLGAVVFTLGGVIWSYRRAIFGGGP